MEYIDVTCFSEQKEDYKKLQEEVMAAKPKGTVRVGPPQIERWDRAKCNTQLMYFVGRPGRCGVSP